MVGKKARVFALLLCCFLMTGLFAACANEGGNTNTSPSTAPISSSEPEASSPSAAPEEPQLGYPICAPGEVALEYWFPMFTEIMANFTDWNETEVRKEAEKRTGVRIKWITPNSQNAVEIYNVMISSGDYPDLICSNSYNGGGDGAIQDEVYILLNDLIDRYAPNYKNFLDSNEAYYKDTRTDSGNMWAFYILYAMDKKASGGLVWRQDIAADLGWTSIPRNVAQFDDFLQDAKRAGHSGFFSPPQYGFITGYGGGILPASFGASTIFLNVDGKVHFGPMMDGFRDYVTQMKEWYDEGIIDPDFMSVPFFMSWPDIATGKYLVGVGVNGILGEVFAKNGVSDDPDCYIAALAPMAEADGTPVRSGNYASYTASPTAISTACENVEAAVRWLDYWYSEDGIILRNYGIEGYSFEYDANGQPKYKDIINNNPDVPTATAMQTFLFTSGPGYAITIYESEHVRLGNDVWADFSPDWNMPANISLTQDEATRYSTIMADVNTFCEETVAKMIIGVISLDDYDTAFVDRLKNFNIDEAVAIQQAALDRYHAR